MLNLTPKNKIVFISILAVLAVMAIGGFIGWRNKPKADEITATTTAKSYGVLWGIITDDQKRPLPDIVILLGGVGTQTDAQGRYALVVPTGDYDVPIFRNSNATQQYEASNLFENQISLKEGFDVNYDFQLHITDQITAIVDAAPPIGTTATPTAKSTPAATPSPCAYDTIKTLTITIENQVKYTYCLALGREGEAGGVGYWKGVQQANADPRTLVVTFTQSDEFKVGNKVASLSNEDYVKLLYRKFLLREAEPGGLGYWAGLLNQGQSRESVASQIIHSDEFAAKHTIYKSKATQ